VKPSAAALLLVCGATAASAEVISSIDLSKPFGTRTQWSFTAVQGPEVENRAALLDDKAPGAITLCLSNDSGRSCRPDLRQAPRFVDDLFAEPHYLDDAEIVHPRPGQALFLLRTSSLHSGVGDQLVLTRLLAYDRARDQFIAVYERSTGRNNNQEIRYVVTGPVRGAVILAEPTENAPFGYWITLSRLAAGRYVQVLRYRSATRYADGNPLSVIDSEMPNIELRLGLWHAGSPLPLPKGPCPKPHLIRMTLWCN
jgi:hypothetical protein